MEHTWGSDNKYKCFNVHMCYQAGYAQMEEWTSGHTEHGGVGWFHPFGPSRYYCGTEFKEAEAFPLDDYFSEYWKEVYDTSLFCVYQLEDGNIYARDGIFCVRGKSSNVEIPLDSDPDCMYRNVLVNVIVGGSGAYEGAVGLMIGTTEGSGKLGPTPDGGMLPEALIKDLTGWIKVPLESLQGRH